MDLFCGELSEVYNKETRSGVYIKEIELLVAALRLSQLKFSSINYAEILMRRRVSMLNIIIRVVFAIREMLLIVQFVGVHY